MSCEMNDVTEEITSGGSEVGKSIVYLFKWRKGKGGAPDYFSSDLRQLEVSILLVCGDAGILL